MTLQTQPMACLFFQVSFTPLILLYCHLIQQVQHLQKFLLYKNPVIPWLFLHLSFSHPAHRGLVCLSACWDTSPGRHPLPPGQTPQADPQARHSPSQTPPPDGPCSGLYASYWNAVLYFKGYCWKFLIHTYLSTKFLTKKESCLIVEQNKILLEASW